MTNRYFKKFLPPSEYKFFKKTKWIGLDNIHVFKKNKKIQPSDWPYHTQSVTYTLNSEQYRTYEFDQVDWKNAIVLFGCSLVYGTGVDDSDTIAANLEKITGIQVVNLGQGGTSCQYLYHNNVILAENFPTPKAVVNIWTSFERTIKYGRFKIDNIGPWNTNNTKDLTQNAVENGILFAKSARLIWKNTKYYEASFFPEVCKELKCDGMPGVDTGRDCSHPGPKTNALIAKQIKEKLKL